MTPNNFKWYLHALLFLHTQRVIKVQIAKAERHNENEEEEEEDDDDDDDDDDSINQDE